jgi:MFS family permease
MMEGEAGAVRTGPSEASPYSRRQALVVVAVMALVTLTLGLVIMPMNVMVDPIRETLRISDLQISLLLGAVAAAPFVVMSLAGGWLSDRLSRRLLLLAAVVSWTLGAALCATAGSYETFLVGRVLVNVGAGLQMPVALTWINDAFPPAQRGRAVGAFFVVLGVGPALSVMLAGVAQRAAEGDAFASWAAFLGPEAWRAATLVLALPSLLTVLAVLGLPDRRSASARAAEGAGARATPALPLGLIGTLVAAASLIAMVDGANLAWMATVFTRDHGYDARQAGFAFGLVTFVAGSLGPLAGGWLGDMLYRRHGTVGRVWFAAVACLCCAPLLAAYAVKAPGWLTLALVLNGMCTMAALSSTYINAQALLPDGARGLGTGVIVATTAILGSAGPTLVALSSEHLLAGPMVLPRSIALVGACGSLLAATVLAAGALRLRRSGTDTGPARTRQVT